MSPQLLNGQMVICSGIFLQRSCWNCTWLFKGNKMLAWFQANRADVAQKNEKIDFFVFQAQMSNI